METKTPIALMFGLIIMLLGFLAVLAYQFMHKQEISDESGEIVITNKFAIPSFLQFKKDKTE